MVLILVLNFVNELTIIHLLSRTWEGQNLDLQFLRGKYLEICCKTGLVETLFCVVIGNSCFCDLFK